MQENENMNLVDKARMGMSILGLIAQTGGVSVEVFLHGRFEARYLGMPAFAALLLIPLFGIFFEGDNIEPLLALWRLYVLMLMFAWVGILLRGRGPKAEHSRYSGRPRFFRCKTGAKELRVKLVYEPLLVFLVGVYFSVNGNIPLGDYLLFAAACLFIKTRMQKALETSVEWDMRDAMLEQRQRIERLREMHGG